MEPISDTAGADFSVYSPMPRNRPHVASINYAKVYRCAFKSLSAARAFVQRVEAGPNKKLVAMHQAARMVWLADKIDRVAQGRPALQVMFYLIAAEAVAKLYFDYEGERHSLRHVQRFFKEICGPLQQARLEAALRPINSAHPLPLEDAVDFFYNVRCDVAHRGLYYDLHLPDADEAHEYIDHCNGQPIVIKITLAELRQTILEGAVRASTSPL